MGPLLSTWRAPADAGFPTTLRAAKRGEEWAVAELWRDLHPRLLRYLRASTRDGSADDLASDVWIDVARGLGGFEGDEQALWGWVFTIAWRRLMDARRRASRRRTNPIEPDVQAQLAGATEADFEAQEALDEALSLVANLPRAQAEVVLLRVLGDLSVETTAEILDKRPGAVRILQHRAFARLRGQLRSRY